MNSIDFRHNITVQHTVERNNRDSSGHNNPPGSPNLHGLRAIAREYKTNCASCLRLDKVNIPSISNCLTYLFITFEVCLDLFALVISSSIRFCKNVSCIFLCL